MKGDKRKESMLLSNPNTIAKQVKTVNTYTFIHDK